MGLAGLAVVAAGLRKRYGEARALDGFDLEVPAGSVCGLLGPNGAGKTTAVRVLSTLLRPDAGRAEVAGFDVVRRASEVRHKIGLAGQHAAVDEVLTGRQNLEMFGRLYHLGGREARRRADALLEQFRLAEAAGRQAGRYSGGMRRRLDLAASFILSPPVLFLDEPTAGLDPRGRNEVWDAVHALVDGGTTVLLTTQYLDEADQLAGKIVVIDAGRAIAAGTPDELKRQVGGDRLDILVRRAGELPAAARVVGRVCNVEPEVDPDTRLVSAPVDDRVGALTGVLRALGDAGVVAEDVRLRRPTLDDVFLRITGRKTGGAEKEEVAV